MRCLQKCFDANRILFKMKVPKSLHLYTMKYWNWCVLFVW